MKQRYMEKKTFVLGQWASFWNEKLNLCLNPTPVLLDYRARFLAYEQIWYQSVVR